MLAAKEEQLGEPWNGYALSRYNSLVEQQKVPRFVMMGVYSARKVVTPAMLRGIAESIRTQALELALDLQAVDPHAGEVGGPTREDPDIHRALTVNINHIYGDGANVAQGTGITQTAVVAKGDIVGLTGAISRLLTDQKAIGEAVAVITSDGSDTEKRSKLERLGGAIKSGSVALAAGVTSDMAATGLIALAGQFLGW
ncbi:hypothetical protein FBY40_1598 [Microbacterium sp. SLBN-154]|nr:hypothetical protein FBY40_1598 [Microbacterium sp. SLBN-154]